MEKLIFVGTVYPDGVIENLLEKKSFIDFPSHNFQSALIRGFEKTCEELSIITTLKCSNFPQIKTLYFKDRVSIEKTRTFMIGRINLPFINLFYRFSKVIKYLIGELDKNRENYVVVYSVHTPFLLSMKILGYIFNIKSCLIIPDLPQYMSSSKSLIYKVAKRIDFCIIKKLIKTFDCYAPLSPYMKEKLSWGDKPFVQIEGVYDNLKKYSKSEKSATKSILYTGKLDQRYGIIDLIDSFSLIKDDSFELWIRGTGNALSIVKEKMSKDPRVKLFPQLPKAELVKLQKSAHLLVNPLHSSEPFTRYFFPSKTLEYMASGTPTLMCHLACIPEEYNHYLFFFDDESKEGMASKMIEVLSKPSSELFNVGESAKSFILNKKNGYTQALKIINLLIGA